tara:strand:- start:4788 stop:5264 length:477 start_codon:yes stop_codon:yes gene_type:complete
MNIANPISTSPLTSNNIDLSLDRFFELEIEWTNTGQPAWSKEQFLRELPLKWQLSFIAVIDCTIVGYLIGSKGTSEPQSSRVNKIVIDRRHQRKGIGKLLMECYFEASMRLDLNRCELTAMCEYTPADRLYTSLGYNNIKTIRGNDGKLRNYYVKILQ